MGESAGDMLLRRMAEVDGNVFREWSVFSQSELSEQQSDVFLNKG